MEASMYTHQSWNHMVFDKVRDLQLQVDFLKAYLKDAGGENVASEIECLDEISHRLFDEVYKPLREKWL